MDFCKEHTSFVSDLAEIKTGQEAILQGQERLDKRINGTLENFNKHLEESTIYRGKTMVLEALVSKAARERVNTTKKSQWRIGLIVGVICGLPNFLIGLIVLLNYLNR